MQSNNVGTINFAAISTHVWLEFSQFEFCAQKHAHETEISYKRF
jgi:hypothetical protein